jgi:hypothetical protein
MDMRRDQRLSPRRNTMIEALIAFNGGRSFEPCIIRNLSDGGAKLEVYRAVGNFPNSFDLVVPGHKPQSCRVAWRALREIGVQFL